MVFSHLNFSISRLSLSMLKVYSMGIYDKQQWNTENNCGMAKEKLQHEVE